MRRRPLPFWVAGGKQHMMPCHHALAEALHAYIAAAGIAADKKAFLFRTSRGHGGTALADQPMTQVDASAWCASARSRPALWRRSATTHSARQGSRRTSPMGVRWSMLRKWRRTNAHAQPNCRTKQKSDLHQDESGKNLGCEAFFR
jgi:hypothetical protein